MSLQSMTGFARAEAEDGLVAVTWELRSVNGRGLEARLRLPPGYDRLEQSARGAILKMFSRGNVQASLNISRDEALKRPVVDEKLLAEFAAIAHRLHEEHGTAPATADGLMSLRGVMEMLDNTSDQEGRDRLDALILRLLDEALQSLKQARSDEGSALVEMLLGQVTSIEALTLKAEADPSREPDNIRKRLEAQLRPLLDSASQLDETRLYQEAALLATKADIREEIDRLKTHVASARALLKDKGPAGRKLDFLAQEFNRESNTLCSKANAATVTAIGLDLKVVVDQFREQIQNLE